MCQTSGWVQRREEDSVNPAVREARGLLPTALPPGGTSRRVHPRHMPHIPRVARAWLPIVLKLAWNLFAGEDVCTSPKPVQTSRVAPPGTIWMLGRKVLG